MFLGGPIRQGFHKGFYKTSGKRAVEDKTVSALESVGTDSSSRRSTKTASASGSGKKSEKPQTIDAVFQMTETKMVEDVPSKPLTPTAQKVEALEKGQYESGLSYRTMIGLMAGICVVVAFVFQLMEMNRAATKSISLSFAVLLAVGFFLWTVYGISVKLLPIWLSGALACLFSISISIQLWKNKQ